MTDSAGFAGIVDAETALRREIEVMTQRFPQLPPEELATLIRDTYNELKRGAEVEAHLLAVTRSQVTEQLRERGVESHLRDDEQEEHDEHDQRDQGDQGDVATTPPGADN